jgi:hypothetical protein
MPIMEGPITKIIAKRVSMIVSRKVTDLHINQILIIESINTSKRYL